MLKLTLIIVCALLVCAAGSQAQKRTYAEWSRFDPTNFDPKHTFSFSIGDLNVVIGDAYAHADSGLVQYTGIHHLSHRLRASNVFCPLYAGLIGSAASAASPAWATMAR